MQKLEAQAKPKAYSYLRFSTPEQQKGDSFRRQTTMAASFAARKGLDLDAALTFHDLGVSAFKGANAETGRLADFREAVVAGLVPQGSFLLVEALDRISRASARKALRVLEDIVDAGVTVVTLNDEKAYTSEGLNNDPMDLLMAILVFMRGNEESATKSRRGKATWVGKRLNAGSKPLTRSLPGWIAMELGSLVLIDERATIVRRIFTETLEGHGQISIARRLITDGTPCFGRATHWHRTYISKILQNPATHGVFVPHEYRPDGARVIRVPLTPIEGYFPPVISLETFEAAQRGGGTAHRVKARVGQLANIFGGLATCPICAGSMTRVNKGSTSKGGKPKLVCAKAKAGAGCDYRGIHVGIVEDALLTNLGSFISDAPSGVAGLDEELEKLEVIIDVYFDEADNLVKALAGGASLAISAKLRELEGHLADAQAEQAAVRERIVAGSSPVLVQRLREVEAVLLAEPLDRARANILLRTLLTAVVVDYPNGRLTFNWKHGGESSISYGWPLEK